MSDATNNGSIKANTYKAFGLTISSCIRCPELLPGSGAGDARVVYGNVPRELPGAKHNGVCYQAVPGQLLLDVDRVARFLVRYGNEIVIERHADAHDDDVRLFLLGSAFGALLHQRGILALHGSTIQVDDGCVVFLGKSGMGKSTLATALVRRGYVSLGDDVCAVSIGDDDVPYAAPAYPQAKLWRDSLHHFGIDPAGLQRIRPSREKRALPLESFSSAERVPVKRLYVLSRRKGDPSVSIMPLTGPPRIRVLRDCTYRVEYLQGLNLTVPHFKQIVHFASRLPLARIFGPSRDLMAGPTKLAAVEKLASAVEQDFRSLFSREHETHQLAGIVSQVR